MTAKEVLAEMLTLLVGTLVIAPITFIATFLLSLPFVLYQAWVFVILWKWFVIPVFSVPPLQFGYSYGLLLIVWFLVPSSRTKTEYSNRNATDDREKPALITELVLVGLIGPTCSLAAGWVVKALLCPE
jgi:hypothetical protein